MEKVKALFKSRRFWTAIGGVVVVAAQETLGLDPETTNRIVALLWHGFLVTHYELLPLKNLLNLNKTVYLVSKSAGP